MAAESIKDKPLSKKLPVIKQRRARGRPHKSNTNAILTLATTTPATTLEIAESLNISNQAVHQTLNRYGIEPNHIKSYKEHRIDILTGIEERLISKIDEDKLTKASVNNIAYAFKNIHDARRLEEGLSTANVGIGIDITDRLANALKRYKVHHHESGRIQDIVLSDNSKIVDDK